MKKIYLLFLFASFCSFAQSPSDIIITEIMKNPAAVADSEGEYFEVYNTTASPIDMMGWTVSDFGTQLYTISSSVVVPAGGYAVFGRNADTGANGGVVLDYVADTTFGLNNADDEIILTSGTTVIDQVAYDDGVIFPDPNGASMELALNKYNATDNDDGANWGVATAFYGDGDLGTPGTDNDHTLSINQFNISIFSVYPNPTSLGFINILSKSSVKINASIFDVLGKEVLSKTVENGELNVSNLNEGIYIIKLSTVNAFITKKIVIK